MRTAFPRALDTVVPRTWSRPNAAQWTTTTRATVTASGYGPLRVDGFTASRSCFGGRPRVGNAAFRHEMMINFLSMRSSGPSAGGIGLQLDDASDWYGWEDIANIAQYYEGHEVAMVPTASAVQVYNGNPHLFWALDVGDSTGGTQQVLVQTSLDGISWSTLVTKAAFAKVGSTGVYAGMSSAPAIAAAAVLWERYI